jgi:hypothetical protein
MWIRRLPEQFGLRTLARRPFGINRPGGVAPHVCGDGDRGGAYRLGAWGTEMVNKSLTANALSGRLPKATSRSYRTMLGIDCESAGDTLIRRPTTKTESLRESLK